MLAGLSIALIAGLIAMLGWGTSDFFAKKSVDKIDYAIALFWMQTLGIIPLLIFFLFRIDFSGITSGILWKVALLAIIDMIGYLFFYRALEKGKVSIVGPIVASYSALSVIIMVIFLGEKLSPLTIIFLSLIFIGIIITSIDFGELKKYGIRKQDLTKGVPEAILGALFFSIWFPFWDRLQSGQNWLTLVVILRSISALFLLGILKISKKTVIVKDKTVFYWLLIVGLLDAIAYAGLTWGYGLSSYSSIIIMLSATYSVPTLILARIFLKEKLPKIQIFGITLILLSIALLALVR